MSYSTIAMGDDGKNPGIYYLENDICQPERLASVWIYEETNGIPGLQRDDVIQEWCHVDEGDTIIF